MIMLVRTSGDKMEDEMREPSGLLPVQDTTSTAVAEAAARIRKAMGDAKIAEAVRRDVCPGGDSSARRTGNPRSLMSQRLEMDREQFEKRFHGANDRAAFNDATGLLDHLLWPDPDGCQSFVENALTKALTIICHYYPEADGEDPRTWARAELADAPAAMAAASVPCSALYAACSPSHVGRDLFEAWQTLRDVSYDLGGTDYGDQVIQYQLAMEKRQDDISAAMARESSSMACMTKVILICTLLTFAMSIPSCIVNCRELCAGAKDVPDAGSSPASRNAPQEQQDTEPREM